MNCKFKRLVRLPLAIILNVIGMRCWLGYAYHGWHWLSTLGALIGFLGSSSVVMFLKPNASGQPRLAQEKP